MVNIDKFHKKEILIQPPGEPREQHLGEARKKKLELHKMSKNTKILEGSIYIGAPCIDAFLSQLHMASKFQNISIGNFKTS